MIFVSHNINQTFCQCKRSQQKDNEDMNSFSLPVPESHISCMWAAAAMKVWPRSTMILSHELPGHPKTYPGVRYSYGLQSWAIRLLQNQRFSGFHKCRLLGVFYCRASLLMYLGAVHSQLEILSKHRHKHSKTACINLAFGNFASLYFRVGQLRDSSFLCMSVGQA